MADEPRGRGRLFLFPSCIEGRQVSIPDEEAHHLRKVLRLVPGDVITVTDGAGSEYLVRLDSGGAGTILRESRPVRESPLRTVLVQALPKGEKMEYLLQKAVELGASGIRPVTSRRSVAAVKEDRWRKRKYRLEKIAAAAVAQSGRTVLPEIADPETWQDFLGRDCEADLKLICREGAAAGLDAAPGSLPRPQSVIIAVGPEGGWDEEEIAMAAGKGYRPFSLGPRTLRTETAGIAALTLLQYLYGDIGPGEKRD